VVAVSYLLRRDINHRIQALKPKSVRTYLANIFNSARIMITSLDLSAVLRQGGFVAFGHPVRASKSLMPMFRAAFSAKKSYEINNEILSRPNAPLYWRSGLYIAPTEADAKLSQQEEAYMSEWVEKYIGKIPVVGPLITGSQRAYVTFLNKLRADSFDAMVDTLGRNGEVIQVEAEAIANYVNAATGRGDLTKYGDRPAVGLNTAFFAPRYVASRFQMLAGQPLYKGTAATRKMIAKEYARYLIGLGVVYSLGMAAGGEVEDDPRSSDFGKIRFGNTRIDPLSGFSQVAVLTSRIVSGKTKSSVSGRIKPTRGKKIPYGGDDTWNVFSRFLRSKLSPAFSTAFNVAGLQNVIGEPVTPKSVARDLTVPLYLRDIYEAIEDLGVPKGTAMGLVALFGMGLQSYGNKKKKRRK